VQLYLASRIIAQGELLQVLDTVSGYELEGARVPALATHGLVLAPVGAELLDADAPAVVHLRLQRNVRCELSFDPDFGHLRHARVTTCKKKMKEE
jgi:hypothetical protein